MFSRHSRLKTVAGPDSTAKDVVELLDNLKDEGHLARKILTDAGTEFNNTMDMLNEYAPSHLLAQSPQLLAQQACRWFVPQGSDKTPPMVSQDGQHCPASVHTGL